MTGYSTSVIETDTIPTTQVADIPVDENWIVP